MICIRCIFSHLILAILFHHCHLFIIDPKKIKIVLQQRTFQKIRHHIYLLKCLENFRREHAEDGIVYTVQSSQACQPFHFRVFCSHVVLTCPLNKAVVSNLDQTIPDHYLYIFRLQGLLYCAFHTGDFIEVSNNVQSLI